jgi:hypothetical protein
MKRAARIWSLEATCLGFGGDFSFLIGTPFGGAATAFVPGGFVLGNWAVFIIMQGAAILLVARFALWRTRTGVELKMLRDEGEADGKMSESEEAEAEALFWCEALRSRVNLRKSSSLSTLSLPKRIDSHPITSSLFSLCLCMDLEEHQCGPLRKFQS